MKRTRLWTGLSSLLSFLFVFVIMSLNCMMDYAGVVNEALGIRTSKVVNESGDGTVYYESGYGTLNAENLQKLIADTYEQCVLEEEEGAVLLKNENGALPLSADEKRVTLFGYASAHPLYKGDSAGSKASTGEYGLNLYDALSNEGFSINDTLYKAYEASTTERGAGRFKHGSGKYLPLAFGEEESSFYTDELKQSWQDDYNDVAIVMLCREGSEGGELHLNDPFEGISQLALHQVEKDLLQMIKDSGKFDKTIVLLNSGHAMELGWLDDYDVDACLWIGLPGQRGLEGVVNVLTGSANPSGRLVDTYAANSLSAPSITNGSYNNQIWVNQDEVTETVKDNEAGILYYTVQAEGIYVGYKYYETRYEDAILKQGNATSAKGSIDGTSWDYSKEVVYPFGYGLSYTEFEQKINSVEVGEDSITVSVDVTNIGDVAGKSAVQVYAQTPYGNYEKKNLVEKSAIQLLDFGKTDMLEPGQSETVTIECDKYLLASYDYLTAKGYIMSEGDYYLAIGDNVHDALNNILSAKGAEGMIDADGHTIAGNASNSYHWTESFDNEKYKLSRYTGTEVTNQFKECDMNYWHEDSVTYLSRADWENTWPSEAVAVEATPEMMEVLSGEYYQKPEDAPSVSAYTQGERQNMPLAALIGADYDDPKWEEYLNQFTVEEMASLMADSSGTVEVPETGKPAVIVGDGPDGPSGTFDEALYGDGRAATCFPCEVVLASTFNKDLLTSRGELIAEECLYLGMVECWMPGANLHRTPFGGRNYEYYSEDAIMTYLCEIPEVEAMEAKGVHAGIKHLTGNDQENNRHGISVFFNEQAFREGSLRGFEGALAVAGGKAVMHGFNRIGMAWCSSSEALCTSVVDEEWGFVGQQETDAIAGPGEGSYAWHFTSALAAGTDTFCYDFNRASIPVIVKAIQDNDDGYLLGMLRKATHDYLYIVANSAIMNGYDINSVVVSVTPWWKPTMYGVIGFMALADALCLIMLAKSRKKSRKIELEEE